MHGKCHGVESLLFTGSKEGVGLSLIVVTCAKICGGDNRPLAFILFQSMNGVALDSCLLWSGVGYVSSLRGTCWVRMALLRGKNRKKHGRPLPYACFGLFERRRIKGF